MKHAGVPTLDLMPAVDSLIKAPDDPTHVHDRIRLHPGQWGVAIREPVSLETNTNRSRPLRPSRMSPPAPRHATPPSPRISRGRLTVGLQGLFGITQGEAMLFHRRKDQLLELRARGLWARSQVNTPGSHWIGVQTASKSYTCKLYCIILLVTAYQTTCICCAGLILFPALLVCSPLHRVPSPCRRANRWPRTPSCKAPRRARTSAANGTGHVARSPSAGVCPHPKHCMGHTYAAYAVH